MKSKKGKSLYSQRINKGLGLKITACKLAAMKDITQECGKDSFYSRNYLCIESIVLQSCKLPEDIFPISNHKLYNY